MSETRVVTPGSLGGFFFGFIDGFIGSIDDNTLKGNIIGSVAESLTPVEFVMAVDSSTVQDFVGQQVLVGGTDYFLKDISAFSGTQWTYPAAFKGDDMEDAFNASETVTVIFDFRAEQYTTPELVTIYGNQGTLVSDTVNIDLNTNFVVANTVTAANLPPGLSETSGVVSGTLTDNTGPFEVVVTATNSIGTTETTFTWNTYVIGTANSINIPVNSAINTGVNNSISQPFHPSTG